MLGIGKRLSFATLSVLGFVLQAAGSQRDAAAVFQSRRRIPLVRQVDVVVVGASLGATATAVQAARSGASVLLVAPRTYVGDDLCGTLRLWLEPGESPRGELTSRLFAGGRTTTPLEVKRTLEAALLASHVEFLLGSLPTDVLQDEAGAVAGVVIANRAGRQAITVKIVVDATDTAVVARMAGAEMRGVADGPAW